MAFCGVEVGSSTVDNVYEKQLKFGDGGGGSGKPIEMCKSKKERRKTFFRGR